MIRDEYSPYKILHRPYKLEQLRRGEQTVPLQVQIIPSNRCNQACSFCAYRMKGYSSNQKFDDKDMIPTKKIKEILDDCKEMGVEAIQWTGGGEPLVHPDIKELFRYSLSLGLRNALVTNGQNFDEETALICRDFAWVRFSVDCSCRETYKTMRKVDKFDQVWKNIRRFSKMVKRCIVGVGFVVNRENYLEIYDACETACESGVDNFRISGAFTPEKYNYFTGIMEEAKEGVEDAIKDFAHGDFTVFNLFNDRLADTFEGSPQYMKCPFKELVTYIGADQFVYTCCVLAYNDAGKIGSLRDSSFKEVWESNAKHLKFASHNPKTQCNTPCMFNFKNEFINYCIKPDAKHIGYI